MSLRKYEGTIQTVAENLCTQIAPFVRSVRAIAVSEDDILFHIEAYTPIHERKLRLALNLECELEPTLFKSVHSEWQILLVSGNCVNIRFYSASWAFDIAFVEAIVIGLEPFVIEQRQFDIEDIARVFLTEKYTLLEEYRQWINSTLTYKNDLYTLECIQQLRPFWLCCRRHRLLRVARQTYLEKIGYFDGHKRKENDIPDHYHPVFYDHPDTKTMIDSIDRVLSQEYSSAEHTIRDYFLSSIQTTPWQYGLPTCLFWFHGMNQCCSFHLLKSCLHDIHSYWLDYWMWTYGIPFLTTEEGYPLGTGMSINSLSILCLYADVDMTKISMDDQNWFREVPLRMEEMKSEHLLEKVFSHVTMGKPILLSDGEQEFLRAYAERYHHTGEEYLLFLCHLLTGCLDHYSEGSIHIESEASVYGFEKILFEQEGPMALTAQTNYIALKKRSEYRIHTRYSLRFPFIGLLVKTV